MPSFEYHAVDGSQADLFGRIEADDEGAAREQLAARGVEVRGLRAVQSLEPASGPATVSTAEALELAVHLADLTGAQLPLAPGLRALALDLPRGRLTRAIQRLSEHLQQGLALDVAVNMPDVRLPAHVRGLLACGLRSGQPALVLEQFLEHQRMAGELRRRLWTIISYPAILLTLLFAWCLFVFGVLMPDIRKIFTDFDISLPNVSLSLLWVADHGAAVLGWLMGGMIVVLGLVRIIGGRHSFSTLLSAVPIFGQIWRDRGLAEFANLLGLLLEHATPLPTALDLTAQGISDGALADACRRSAQFAAAGHRLTDSIVRARHFPPSLTPILAWGDRASAQPEALRVATEMFRTRTELRAQFLAVIMPPLIFVVIGITMLFVVFGMLAPMLRLIQSFSMLVQSSGPSISASSILPGAVSLLLIGTALLISLRLVYADAKPVFDPMYGLLRIAATVILQMGWLALLAGLFHVFGVAIWVITLLILDMVLHQSQLTRQRVHLALVAAAAEKQIPLAPCMEAFAQEQGGRFGLRARELAADLRRGTALGAAIARSRRVLPRGAQMAARVGQECGRLGPALREEIVSLSESSVLRSATAGRLIYVYILLLTVPLITTFVMLKIVPSFQKIYADFDITLPAMTTFVIRLAANPTVRGLLGISSLLAMGMLVCGALWYVGWPAAPPPGLGRLLLRFDRGRILRALAFPAEQGRPLEPMIESLAATYPNRGTRRRLRQAAAQITDGHDWIASFRSQGLVAQVDAAVLQAAQRVGNLPWALREMAESNARRLLYRLEVLLQVGSILMIVLFGMLTAMFCVALFVPLVKLINALSH